MKILSDEELMHTGPAAVREYCKSLAASLRDATEENAKLREGWTVLLDCGWYDADYVGRALQEVRKLLESDDAKPEA